MHFYLSVFLFHVLITYGYCDIKNNIYKLLSSLNNDKDLRSFNFFPIKIYLKSDEDNEGNLYIDHNFGHALRTSSGADFAKSKIQTSKTGKLLRYQHRRKMEELIEFLRERYSSTNYFYNEMKRIQRQYTVKDKMREMIDYCEHPQNHKVKERILKLFDKLKKKNEVEQSLWNDPTNNLIINVLQDPYNDGVMN